MAANIVLMTKNYLTKPKMNKTVRCWSPKCGKKAWLEDCYGWWWCPYHHYFQCRWGGGKFWAEIFKFKFKLSNLLKNE